MKNTSETIIWRETPSSCGLVRRADWKNVELETDMDRTWLTFESDEEDGGITHFDIVDGALAWRSHTGSKEDPTDKWSDEDFAVLEKSLSQRSTLPYGH